MASAAVATTHHRVCHHLRQAAEDGNLSSVTRLLPRAKANNVLNKVHVVTVVCTVCSRIPERESQRGVGVSRLTHELTRNTGQVACGESCTALCGAACEGHHDVVHYLLANGASPRIGHTHDVRTIGGPTVVTVHVLSLLPLSLS